MHCIDVLGLENRKSTAGLSVDIWAAARKAITPVKLAPPHFVLSNSNLHQYFGTNLELFGTNFL
jgi:hypothetical protein